MDTTGVQRGANNAEPKQPWNLIDERKANENNEGTYQRIARHPTVFVRRSTTQAMQRIAQKAEVKVDKREEATEGEQDVRDVGHNQRPPAAHNGRFLRHRPERSGRCPNY